jgi:hypothetical protein
MSQFIHVIKLENGLGDGNSGPVDKLQDAILRRRRQKRVDVLRECLFT